MTGRYSTRIGYEFTPMPRIMPRIIASFDDGNTVRPQYLSDADKAIPREALSVPEGEVFVSQILKAQGYHTLHIGKWHLGQHRGVRPLQKGFDESLGTVRHGSMYLPENHKNVVNAKQPWDVIDRCMWTLLPYEVEFNDGAMFEPKGYATDYFADEAVKAIKANRNRPFFLYFAPNAIHSPLQATRADFDALPDIEHHSLRVYGAMVANLDRNIGRILQALNDEGLEENTMVVFSSDNGGAGYLGLPDINKPYRGWKITFFEGGVHVPYFIKWPAAIPAGSTFEHPVSLIDILPTAAAAAGASLPPDVVIDGVNLLPFVTGEAEGRPHQTLFWRSGQYKSVIDGDWKLQSCEALGRVWLHDLAADPTEHHDLAEARPDKRDALLALLAGQDALAATPLWPSALRAPLAIDQTSNVPIQPGQDYILWDN
jgi:arylsulfatase A-like enzyme